MQLYAAGRPLHANVSVLGSPPGVTKRTDVACELAPPKARAVGDAEIPKPGLTTMFNGADVMALKLASPV